MSAQDPNKRAWRKDGNVCHSTAASGENLHLFCFTEPPFIKETYIVIKQVESLYGRKKSDQQHVAWRVVHSPRSEQEEEVGLTVVVELFRR